MLCVMSTLHADWNNTGNPTQDNGAQFTLQLNGQLGNGATGVVLLPPDDVLDGANYDPTDWSGGSNELGELHALRLELVLLRRYLLWSIGSLFGLYLMDRLFRYA